MVIAPNCAVSGASAATSQEDRSFWKATRRDFVVVLMQGRVKVFCTTGDGREPCLAVRGPGEIIGELAAIDGDQQPRVATVIAVEAVVARLIRANVFLEFVTSRPAVAVALLRTIVARLRRAIDGTSSSPMTPCTGWQHCWST